MALLFSEMTPSVRGGAGEKKEKKTEGRWLDSIRNDLSERELSWEEAQDK